MKYKGYKWIFIGTLLVIFNIQLGSLIIFPDIVGYIVIAIGVRELTGGKSNLAARMAMYMAWLMVIAKGLSGFVLTDNSEISIWAQGIHTLIGIVNLSLRYSILELEKESLGEESEGQVYKAKQRNYLILHVVTLVAITCQINVTSVGILLILLSFCQEVYWLSIIYGLKKKYAPTNIGSDNE